MKTFKASNCRKQIIVDDSDYNRFAAQGWMYKQSIRKTTVGGNKFAVERSRRKEDGPGPEKIILAREILGVRNPKVMVDHINRKPWDNRRSNLRTVTHQQNRLNAGVSRNNTTGYSGVYRIGKKFYARVRLDGRYTHLGIFPSARAAARARDDYFRTQRRDLLPYVRLNLPR